MARQPSDGPAPAPSEADPSRVTRRLDKSTSRIMAADHRQRSARILQAALALALLIIAFAALGEDKVLVGFLVVVPLVIILLGVPWICIQRFRRAVRQPNSTRETPDPDHQT